MTTAAPFASPLKNVTAIVYKTAAGPPTLANAAFPTKRPTIIVSTVVYNCWIKVPSMIGKKNIKSCFQIIPSVIAFISIVFFPKFFSSLTSLFLYIFCKSALIFSQHISAKNGIMPSPSLCHIEIIILDLKFIEKLFKKLEL